MEADIQRALHGVKAVKVRRVADAFAQSDKPDWDDLDVRPSVVFWRAGREVATIHARHRDHAVRAARHGVPAFGADSAAFLMDAFNAKPKWFRDRRRAPKPGELGRVLRDKGRSDLVTESLTVVWADRLGTCSGVTLDFELDFEAKDIRWGEPGEMFEDEDRRITGIIPDGLRTAFDLEQHMVTLRSLGLDPADFHLTDQQARIEGDIAIVRTMVRFGYIIRLACHSAEDAERAQESFEDDKAMGYYAIGPHGPLGGRAWPGE